MISQPILVLIIISLVRKSLNTSVLLPRWNRLLLIGIGIAIALMLVSAGIKDSRSVIPWLGQLLVLALVAAIYTQLELKKAKPIMNAFLPVILIGVLEQIIKFISPSFFKEWDDYFDIAEIFSIIWLAAMLITNNRQLKALEKERLKAEEKEKEFKITETLKAALEVQVAERTAELTSQKEELQHALDELTSTQALLIQSEKMASLGELTAGIAHEIQNPLNFVNNFSEVNAELIAELKEEIDKGNYEEVRALANDIADNEAKINHHGKRADGIVKGMLQHSRSTSAIKEPTDINALADEYLRLSYHGLRAKDKTFNASMKTSFDASLGKINVVPQDLGRVILNLLTNAFYAVAEKKKNTATNLSDPVAGLPAYEPTVTVTTKKIKLPVGGEGVEITIADNGNGIPAKVMDKIFQPFFTTKPTGKGTGLGLSLSYDIIKAHNGDLSVETEEGKGAAFLITLPI